jgi:hypothetical protein
MAIGMWGKKLHSAEFKIIWRQSTRENFAMGQLFSYVYPETNVGNLQLDTKS